MKINSCQFNDSYFPIMDGVGMTAHNYAHWMNVKHGNASLVAPNVNDYKDRVDYHVIRFKSVLLPGMNPYRVGLPMIDFKFKKKLAKNNFDILHAHCPFISGQLALKLARKLDIPVVATFHTKYRDDFKKALSGEMFVEFLMTMTMDFYNRVDVVWVPNRATGETLKEYGFTGVYEIMPNGTDFDIPEKGQYLKYRRKGLEEIGADNDDFVLLFVGQHRWEKNVRTILESLKILKEKKVSFKMVFAGEGYAAKEMKTMARQYGVADHVLFQGVITERSKMKHLFACADLFVFPSIYDNAPLVMREAAAFDVPSVVVRNTSSAEGILENVNGFLISNSAESLAEKIIELKANPASIKRAGEGARKSIYRHWDSIIDEVNIKYEEIINRHHSNHDIKSFLEVHDYEKAVAL
ncbi:MAG: glycosyltransferase [Bacteroidetes bacterium]|nr:glycosyltransferase [Bacteroidota bacterium]